MRRELDEPTPAQPVHEMTFRVCMRDMDHANIYFGTYYEWMDRAFADFLQSSGHSVREIFDAGLGIPIVESRCTYLTPVALDEVLCIRSWISGLGRTSFTVTHEFTRTSDGARVARGAITHVWIDRVTNKALEPPAWFRGLSGR